MANNKYETSFDVNTIEAEKGNALSISQRGNLNMDAKIANPNYDPKCKDKSDPAYYKMTSIKNIFKFFLVKPDGSVAFEIQDHLNLQGGIAVTAFGREFSTENK